MSSSEEENVHSIFEWIRSNIMGPYEEVEPHVVPRSRGIAQMDLLDSEIRIEMGVYWAQIRHILYSRTVVEFRLIRFTRYKPFCGCVMVRDELALMENWTFVGSVVLCYFRNCF